MDVRMPDGTVISNVPEGITRAELVAKLKANGFQFRQPDALDDPNMAVAGMSDMEKFRAGIGQAMNSVGQALSFTSKDKVDEAKKRDAPLMNTGAGAFGSLVGNIASTAPAAFIPGANTILGAGLIGGGVGALTTPGDMTDRATGAVLGGAGGMAGQAIPRAFGIARAAAEPLTEKGQNAIVGRVMNRAAGDNAQQVMQRMSGARELVPGSAPTAAEVANSGGIAALQRAMSAANPEPYTQRGMEQASARLNALRGIAQDDVARNAAVSARESAVKPLYDAAKAAAVKPDSDLVQIMNRMPAGVTERAANLARMDGVPFWNTTTGRDLHYIKLALDDALDFNPANSIGKSEKSAIAGVKNDFLGWLEKNIPEYGQARTQYSSMSKPINQMDVGRALLDKMQGPLADHGALASETGARFANALRNEGETVARNATGFRQGLGDVLSPQQMAAVNAIAQDLARKSNAQNLGRGAGSNTFQNFAMDNLSEQMGMPSAVRGLLGYVPGLSPTATLIARGAGFVGNKVYSNADDAIRARMAMAMLDPKEAAALMEAAAKPGKLQGLLMKMPQKVQEQIPPEDIIRLLQAAPGLLGASAASAYAHQ